MKAITAVGVGALIGAAIAILFTREETLSDLTGRVNDRIERGAAKARKIVRQTTEMAAQLKDQVQSVQDAVDAGVRAFKEAKGQETH
jgi:hypothetical protein